MEFPKVTILRGTPDLMRTVYWERDQAPPKEDWYLVIRQWSEASRGLPRVKTLRLSLVETQGLFEFIKVGPPKEEESKAATRSGGR